MPTPNRTADSRPVCVDIFAGVGGLSLGMEQAGFDVVAAVEIDPIHAAVHKYNFPYSATICRDIRKITGADIRKMARIGRRSIDVLVGGHPCQGFSVIGKRRLRDARNSLTRHCLRMVEELKPKYCVFENVPGIKASPQRRLLDELVDGLKAAGYRVQIETLNAAEYGVPQDRARLFILGARGDVRVLDAPVPQTASRRKQPRDSGSGSPRPLCPSVGDAIGDLPKIEEFDELLATDQLDFSFAPWSVYAMRLRNDLEDLTDYSYRRTLPRKMLSGCARTVHSDDCRSRFEKTKQGTEEVTSRLYRLAWDGIATTLRSGTNRDRGAFSAPRPIHPIEPRAITVREAARLHSYPDWFQFHRTRWHGFRQIGNSVPPLLARAVGVEIMSALRIPSRRPGAALSEGDPELLCLNTTEAAQHFGVSSSVIRRRRR